MVSIGGSVQNCSNSGAPAMEFLLSFTDQSNDIMFADDLAMPVSKASASLVLTEFTQNILLPRREGLLISISYQWLSARLQ